MPGLCPYQQFSLAALSAKLLSCVSTQTLQTQALQTTDTMTREELRALIYVLRYILAISEGRYLTVENDLHIILFKLKMH